MKKAKKAKPLVKIETVIQEHYQVECPHCHTHLQGGYNKRTIQFYCPHCNNPITIDWDNVINVDTF